MKVMGIFLCMVGALLHFNAAGLIGNVNGVPLQPVYECKVNEIVFVLDVSRTINPETYLELKAFTINVISKLYLSNSSHSSKVAVVVFADSASKRIFCDQYSSKATISSAVMALERGNGVFTNIRDGIVKGGEALRERGCGQRSSVPTQQVLILISDGRANRGKGGKDGIIQAATELRSQGILMLAVGVGLRIDKELLLQIVGNDRYYVTGQTLDTLLFDDTVEMMKNGVCIDEFGESECHNCTIDEDLKKGLNVKESFDEMFIIKNFNGSCYNDRISSATNTIKSIASKLKYNRRKNERCLQQKRQRLIQNPSSSRRIHEYETCLRVECQLKTFERIVMYRERYLENEWTCDVYSGCGDTIG